MIEEILSYKQHDLIDIDVLMHELSSTSYCNESMLKAAVDDPNVHVIVIREKEHIVATGTLCVKHTLEFTVADVESIVVSSEYRGRGYGKVLMNTLINKAKTLNVHHIQLTSNPKRIVANQLYQDIGFERHETNCYKMVLDR